MNSIFNHLDSCYGGNREAVCEIVKTYLNSEQKLIADIEDACQLHRLMKLQPALHALKGTLGIFGESTAFDLIRRAEFTAKSNKLREAVSEFESARVALKNFRIDLEEILQALGESQ